MRLVAFLHDLPLALLVGWAYRDDLGANPIDSVTRWLGIWTLRLLLVSLSMTPLRILFGLSWPITLRRLLGLFAFFYATVHLLAYLTFDQVWDIGLVVKDVAKATTLPIAVAGGLTSETLAPLDLQNLDDLPQFAGENTTTEFLCRWVHGMLARRLGPRPDATLRVILVESPNAWAAYEAALLAEEG